MSRRPFTKYIPPICHHRLSKPQSSRGVDILHIYTPCCYPLAYYTMCPGPCSAASSGCIIPRWPPHVPINAATDDACKVAFHVRAGQRRTSSAGQHALMHAQNRQAHQCCHRGRSRQLPDFAVPVLLSVRTAPCLANHRAGSQSFIIQ